MQQLVAPDFFIYRANVYWVIWSFITTWSFLNVLAILVKRRKSPLSATSFLWRLVKNMFMLTFAHLRVINSQSRNKTLQLAVLLSVTLMLAIWGSCFSNENIRITPPKIYDTHKSLTDDPPDVIVVFDLLLHRIDRGGFRPSSTENYLRKPSARKRMIDFRELEPKRVAWNKDTTVVGITAHVRSSIPVLRYLMSPLGKNKDTSLVTRKEPNAEKQFMQPLISTSALTKPGGQNVKRVFKVLSENFGARWEGVWDHFKALTLNVPMRNPFRSDLRQFAFSRQSSNTDIKSAKGVTLDSLERFFIVLCLLVVVALVVLVAEQPFNFTAFKINGVLNASLFRTKNRVSSTQKTKGLPIRPHTCRRAALLGFKKWKRTSCIERGEIQVDQHRPNNPELDINLENRHHQEKCLGNHVKCIGKTGHNKSNYNYQLIRIIQLV